MEMSDLISHMDPDEVWTPRDAIVAHEIVRQWLYLASNLEACRLGVLYRRNRTKPSEAQRDPFTDEVVDTSGEWASEQYMHGVSFYMRVSQMGGDSTDIEFPRGLQNVNVLQGIALMAPVVGAGDVWYDPDYYGGTMYLIRPVQVASMVGGIPVASQMVLFELPPDRPEYNLANGE